MSEPRKYMIRDLNPQNISRISEAFGYPVQFAALPDWEFFLRPAGGWVLTEVRSGGKFPTACVDTKAEAVEWFETFIARQGRETCEQGLSEVLRVHGELPKVNA